MAALQPDLYQDHRLTQPPGGSNLTHTGTVLVARLQAAPSHVRQYAQQDLDEILGLFQDLISAVIPQHKGLLLQTSRDGVAAFFGFPQILANDAEAAARAALEMQANLARYAEEAGNVYDLALSLSIGLHRGPVIFKPQPGTPGKQTPSTRVAASAIGLPRRLALAAAPGMILASESTYLYARPLLKPAQPVSIHLKDRGNPVLCYPILGWNTALDLKRSPESPSVTLIGREAELLQLQEVLTSTLNDAQGRFILLTGEAGIGKTRLLEEFTHLLEPALCTILEGRAHAFPHAGHPGASTYSLFVDLLHHYLAWDEKDGKAVLHERLTDHVQRALGRRAGEALPYLEHLLSIKASDRAAEKVRYLDSGQLRQQICLAMRDLLAAEAARRPLLILLEDLHWADEASLGLLRSLLDQLARLSILIVATSRVEQGGAIGMLHETARQLLGNQFLAIQLPSLSDEQSVEMLNHFLEVTDFPSEWQAQILRRAAGIPLYLEELLRMLIGEGLLRRRSRRGQLSPAAELVSLRVPSTLQELILARFEQLNPAQKRFLQVASVVGEQFSVAVVNEVLMNDKTIAAIDPLSRLTSFSMLIDREFIVPVDGHPGEWEIPPNSEDSRWARPPWQNFAFKHILVNEAIYHSLPELERSDLHAQVGQAIEKIFTGHLEGQVEILAHHYLQSSLAGKALQYAILAGQKAARGFANLQARAYFARAVDLFERHSPAIDQILAARSGLGDMLVMAGEYNRAREEYQAAVSALSVSGGSPGISELRRKIGMTLERQGSYPAALRALKEAQAACKHQGEKVHASLEQAECQPQSLVEKARILNDLGWVTYRMGALQEAENALLQASALAERTSQADIMASIYNRLGGIYFQEEDLERAVIFTRKALALRQEIGDVLGLARSWNNLGLIEWKRGAWDSALQCFTRSVRLQEKLGDVEGQVDLHGNLGLLYLDRGHLGKARRHFKQFQALAQKFGPEMKIGRGILYDCRLHLARGEWEEARTSGLNYLERFQADGLSGDLFYAYLYLGQAELGRNDLEQAGKWSRLAFETSRLLAQAGKIPAKSDELGAVLRLQGIIAQVRGDFQQSAIFLEESADIYASRANRLEQGHSFLAQADLEAARGDQARAMMLLDQARDLFKQLGAKMDLQLLEERPGGPHFG